MNFYVLTIPKSHHQELNPLPSQEKEKTHSEQKLETIAQKILSKIKKRLTEVGLGENNSLRINNIGFKDLPVTLQRHIANLTDFRSLSNLSAVSRSERLIHTARLLAKSSLEKLAPFLKYQIKETFLELAQRTGEHVTQLDLSGFSLTTEELQLIRQACPNLQKIRGLRCFENAFEELSKFPKLTDLYLIGSKEISNEKLISSNVQLKHLKHLYLECWTSKDVPLPFVNAIPNLISLNLVWSVIDKSENTMLFIEAFSTLKNLNELLLDEYTLFYYNLYRQPLPQPLPQCSIL